jgi:hypothetical protein
LAPELSLTSAVVKYLVPTRAEAMIATLGRLLGARSFLTGTHAFGRFAKIARDNRIVGLFDGNTLVNLNAIINHFQVITRAAGRGTIPDADGAKVVFDTGRPLPALDFSRLSLLARHGSSVVSTVAGHAALLAELAHDDPGLVPVARLAGWLTDYTERLLATMAAAQPAPVQVPTVSFDLAERFALCFAGAAAVGLWVGSRRHHAAARPAAARPAAARPAAARHDGPQPAAAQPETVRHDGECGTGALWADGVWLRAALARVASALGEAPDADPDADDVLFAELTRQSRLGLLFSLWTCRLAEAGQW